MTHDSRDAAKVSTGVTGLDDILGGGFPRNRIYLIQGEPGTGKTTTALQLLLEGHRLGERTLYVTLSETRHELRAVAAAHGWNLDGIEIFQMSAGEEFSEPTDDENTLYVPAEVELGERMRGLLVEVERVKPRRLVIDSCSELRLLSQSPLRFRRQLLALKQHLVQRDCTVFLLENPPVAGGDAMLQSMVHGVLQMEQLSPLYGAERRRMRVVKLREVQFRGGYHDMTIRKTGVVVFPRLIAAEHHADFDRTTLSCGIAEIDTLLGGGIDRGTSTLFMGPAGSGKSALSCQYAVAAAARGEKVAMFCFDEGFGTLFARAAALGMGLREHVDAGRISVQQVDPAELSPGEFAHTVRAAAEETGVSVVVIDSLNGYLQAMPEEQFLVTQLHELLSYLRQRGVATIMVVAQHGVVGPMQAPIDISYLADTVVLTRFFEMSGRVRKAISVLKKRSGRHEQTIREFALGPGGFEVGPPLDRFRGVLSGVPIQDPTSPAATAVEVPVQTIDPRQRS